MDLNKWLIANENLKLFKLLEEASKIEDREVIFLCVGNSKIWYDSFGPVMGSLLMNFELEKYIYGNTRMDIKASNLQEYIDMINKFHINPFIIVFDSALSKENRGLVLRRGATTCGALSDSKVSVGDLSITYNLTSDMIKDVSNYKGMLEEIKRVARFILFTFKEQKKIAKSL